MFSRETMPQCDQKVLFRSETLIRGLAGSGDRATVTGDRPAFGKVVGDNAGRERGGGNGAGLGNEKMASPCRIDGKPVVARTAFDSLIHTQPRSGRLSGLRRLSLPI